MIGFIAEFEYVKKYIKILFYRNDWNHESSTEES